MVNPYRDGTRCGICAAPTPDGWSLCRGHGESLAALLDGLPALLDDLDTTISRQSRIMGIPIGGRSAVRPLPFHPEASRTHADLTRCLTRWALAYGAGRYAPVASRERAPRASARYLTGVFRLVIRSPDAAELLRDCERHTDRVRVVIDRPPSLVFLGPCADDCPHDLYALPGAALITCPACGRRHDVRDRRAALLAAAEDSLATGAEIARAVSTYGNGQYVSLALIRQWRRRGRIIARGSATRGEPLYRVGDVLDLLASQRRPAVTHDAAIG